MQDAADDNMDDNVMERDGAVDAAWEEEEKDFSESSTGTVEEGTR